MRAPRRPILAALLAIAAAVSPAVAETVFSRRDAVVVNVTEEDLNRVLEAILQGKGGPRFEGSRDRGSKGIHDVRYDALVAPPMLTLDDDGRAELRLVIEEGGVHIGRIERERGKKTARCLDTGAVVDPERPLDIVLDFSFRVVDDDLHLIPADVSIAHPKKSFILVKPSRCENVPLPKWLLWWIGKGKLRKKLAELDDILLDEVVETAAEISDGGFLRKRWEGKATEEGPGPFLELFPDSVDTSGGALYVSLTTSSSIDPGSVREADWVPAYAGRSFVGVSESFLRSWLRLTVAGASRQERRPSRDFRKIMKSDAIYSLIPGLHDVEAKAHLSLGLRVGAEPDIEVSSVRVSEAGVDSDLERVGPAAGERAIVRIRLSELALTLWDGQDDGADLVGTIRIDSALLGVVPFLNRRGGVSFSIVENEWNVSSSGIDFNDELFAALLQELAFGEAFETHYEPLWAGALTLGNTEFRPRYFRSENGYLIVELKGETVEAQRPAESSSLMAGTALSRLHENK